MILRDRWGYFAVGLLAPVCEELVFRGAILRALLGSISRHWLAIAISALLFALIHANPAQMPHAFLVGLLLGWLYYRTSSIVPGIVYHWVNNSVAYVVYNLYPIPQMKLIDLFGSQRTVVAAVLFSLLILLPALYQLNLRLRKAQ
jgi:membrane protease YdiL (CAAX protease family)